MAVFNAHEIFEIAEQIERNGGKFYRQAASMTENEDVKRFLLKLAEMEDQHENYFSSLKEKITKDDSDSFPDIDGQTIAYLQAVASGNVFVSSNAQAGRIKGNESIEEIFEIAIGFEKDTVVYFSSVKGIVPEHLGKGKIDELIKEEIRHISILLEKLNEIQGGSEKLTSALK